MTPTLSKSFSDTQAPNPRFSVIWLHGAFGQIVLQHNHHIIHMFPVFSNFHSCHLVSPDQHLDPRIEDPNSRGGVSRMWRSACWTMDACGGGVLCGAVCRLGAWGV